MDADMKWTGGPTQKFAFKGRLAERPWREGDEVPAVGSMALVSGANQDVESDQHRSYLWRQVVGYTDDGEFVCFQTPGCWPTVERMTNCWFVEVDQEKDGVNPSSGIRAYESTQVETLIAALKESRRELFACQAVIHLHGGFDTAYVTGAQVSIRRTDAALSTIRSTV